MPDSECSGKPNYEMVLQVKDSEWDEFIDVQEKTVEDKSVLQVLIIEEVGTV